MKTVNTLLGTVEILDVRMVKSTGFGNYTIITDIEFEGAKETLEIKCNDSEIYDKVYGAENHSEYF